MDRSLDVDDLKVKCRVKFINKQTFTGIPEVDKQILRNLNDRDLMHIRRTDKYLHHVCNDENFWRDKVEARFVRNVVDHKPENLTYYQQYKDLTLSVQDIEQAKLLFEQYREDAFLAVFSIMDNKLRRDTILNLLTMGNSQLLQLVKQHWPKIFTRTIDNLSVREIWDILGVLIETTNIQMIEYLVDNEAIQLDEFTLPGIYNEALNINNGEIVNWAINRGLLTPLKLDLNVAIKKRQVTTVNVLLSHNVVPWSFDVDKLIKYFKITTITLLFNNIQITTKYIHKAIKYDRLDILKFFLTNKGIHFEIKDVLYAIRHGHLEIANWLRKHVQ